MKSTQYPTLRVQQKQHNQQQQQHQQQQLQQQLYLSQTLDFAGRGLARRVTAAGFVLLVLVLLIQMMMLGEDNALKAPGDVVSAMGDETSDGAAGVSGKGHVHICSSRWNYIEIKEGIDGKNYDMMMCFIPKNGCTVYKKIFRRLKGFKNWNDEGVVHNQKKNGIYLPIKGSSKEAQKCATHQRTIDTYGKSLVILRNPYERLVSGYLDKIDRGTVSRCNFRKKLFGPKTSCSDPIPFVDFVNAIDRHMQKGKPVNSHFDLQVHNCNLNHLHYKLVLDVTRDRQKIYEYLDVPEDEASSHHSTSSHATAIEAYKDPDLVAQVKRMFKKDLDFAAEYGYEYLPPTA